MKKILVAIVICALPPLLAAAEHASLTDVDRLIYADVVKTVLRENPELKAAQKKLQAAQSRIAQQASPADPRIDLERMYAPRGKDPISDAEERNIAVSQEIPFPTTLYLRGRAAKKEALLSEIDYRAKEREILSQTRSAYAELSLSHHHLALLEENIDLMKRMARTIESRYAVGRAPQGQVLKAQVELARMMNMRVAMQQDIETNQAMLNTLMNRAPESPLGIPVVLTPKQIEKRLSDITELAMANSPIIARAKAGVEKSRVDLRLAQSSYLPDLMFTYRRRDMRVETDSHDAILGFTVPLWFWKQQAMVNEARADFEMAEAENTAAANMTRFQIKALVVKLESALRLIQLYDSSVIPQARQALRAAESGYQANKMELMDLIDASRTLLSFHEDYYAALAGSEQALAELERLSGVDLTLSQEEKP